MEDFVEEVLHKHVDELHLECSCDICQKDIMAIALNMLPTKYVVKEEGKTYAKASLLDGKMYVSVLTAITKASEIVAQKPSHQ